MEPGYTRLGLIGMAFAAGWTPCIGPLLGTVMTMVASQPVLYTLILCLGPGAPLPDNGIAVLACHRAIAPPQPARPYRAKTEQRFSDCYRSAVGQRSARIAQQILYSIHRGISRNQSATWFFTANDFKLQRRMNY